ELGHVLAYFFLALAENRLRRPACHLPPPKRALSRSFQTARGRRSRCSGQVRQCPSAANCRDREIPADFAGQPVWNFSVPRNGFNRSSRGVPPKGVPPSFALEIAPMPTYGAEQDVSLPPTPPVPRGPSAGTPRSASPRRSAKISAIAAAKLARASSLVFP